MSFKSLFLFASAALAHSILHRDAPGRSCGTPEPSEQYLQVLQEVAQEEAANNVTDFTTQLAATVDVYLHTVSASQSNLLSDSTLQRQFDVLRADFAPHGYTLRYAGSTKTVNPTWARDGNEMAMKQALRKGTYAALNIYLLEALGGNLGYCYYPTSAPSGSTAFYRDGCSVLATTVPGGSATRYNLGKTATHEAGHWFGLIHTFEGGCTGRGDEVDDTPAQASASSGCPVGRDSCPSQPGLDPIHNYMDYSDDACYEEFTSGQRARMDSLWSRYRA